MARRRRVDGACGGGARGLWSQPGGGAGQIADPVLGGVGPGERARRTRQGFHQGASFAARFINELNAHGKLCDLMIGDGEWIGLAAENKHWVNLNDFFAKEHISMKNFIPATVEG